MPAQIADKIRREVIRRRLLCETYDEIIKAVPVSHGSAVSIFNKWKADLGKPTAEALMDLVQLLKDLDLTAKECATGAELVGIVRRHGIEEEEVGSFLTQLIELLVAAHVPPDTVAQQVQRLLKLAKEAETSVDEVLDKVEGAREEEKRIAAHIEELKKQEKAAAEELQKTLDEKSVVKDNVDAYIKAEAELRSVGLTFADTRAAINAIKNSASMGHDPVKVAQQFASTDNLLEKQRATLEQVTTNEANVKALEQRERDLLASLAAYTKILAAASRLDALGFTETNLGNLAAKLEAIARDRGIPLHIAAVKFMADINGQYDEKLGFETVLANLSAKLTETNLKLTEIQTEYARFKDAVDSREFLQTKGVEDKHLIYLSSTFAAHSSLTPAMLTDDLGKYADIKEAFKKEKDRLDALQAQIRQATLEKEEATKALMQAKEEISAFKEMIAPAIKSSADTAVQSITKAAVLEGLKLKGSTLFRTLLQVEQGDTRIDPLLLGEEVRGALLYYLRYLNPSDPLAVAVNELAERIKEAADAKKAIGASSASVSEPGAPTTTKEDITAGSTIAPAPAAEDEKKPPSIFTGLSSVMGEELGIEAVSDVPATHDKPS